MRELEKMDTMRAPTAIWNVVEDLGSGFTLLIDGNIICCFGVMECWPGVYEAWLIPSIYVRKYSKTFVKTIKQYIDILQNEYKFWRLQTASYADNLHDRWMKALGFQEEGRLRKYSINKNDYKK